jgi:hypothetical protein
MIGSGTNGAPRSLLRATLAFGVIVGAVAYAAGFWLSAGGLERSGFNRFAAMATDDPVTTGSIGKIERVDPCVVLRR